MEVNGPMHALCCNFRERNCHILHCLLSSFAGAICRWREGIFTQIQDDHFPLSYQLKNVCVGGGSPYSRHEVKTCLYT